jgi:hypothetical protein
MHILNQVLHCYPENARNQACELSVLIPAKLFESVYITNNSEKKTILDDFLKKLDGVVDTKVTYAASQASSLIKVLHDCLEEANILIVTIAIQILLRLLELIPTAFSETVTKHILIKVFAKFQSTSSKSALNDMILNLLSASVKSGSMTRNGLIDLLCDTIQSGKKTNSRECALTWLIYRLGDFDTADPGRMSLRDSIEWSYEGGNEKIKSVPTDVIHARLTDILSKESNSKIKAIIKVHLKKFEEVNMQKRKPEKLHQDSEANFQSKRNLVRRPAEEKQSPKTVDESSGAKDLPIQKPLLKNDFSNKLPTESTENDKKSLLNYSNVYFTHQDSIGSLHPGSIQHLRDLIDGDEYCIDSRSLESIFSSLQMIEETEIAEVIDRLIEKLLQSVLHLFKEVNEEADRFMIVILLILAQRAPHFSQHQTLAGLRIVLNCTSMLRTNSADVTRLIELLVGKVGLNAFLTVFQGIYNEVKFTVSVAVAYQDW